VLEEATDVPTGHVGQLSVTVLVVEQRLAVVPDRLVAVHARAVVTEDGLRHEGRGLAVDECSVLDQVLELHDVVGAGQQLVETPVDLGLAGSADLVVSALNDQTGIFTVLDDFVAQIAVVIGGSHREVAALGLDLVAEVATLFFAGAVPAGRLRVHRVERAVPVGLVTHVIENVELGLGSEVRGVADAGGAEVCLSLPRDVAGVAAVGLLRQRVMHEEVDHQRLRLTERIQVSRGGVGHQGHVRLVDRLEASHGRAVECQALLENFGTKRTHRHSEVLHHSWQIAETDVDVLDVLVLQIRQEIIGALEHGVSFNSTTGLSRPAESVNGFTLSSQSSGGVARVFQPCNVWAVTDRS